MAEDTNGSMIRTDNLTHNLTSKSKKTVDNALLNLGVEEGTEKPASLSGHLHAPKTFSASLVLEAELNYVSLNGVLSVPTVTPKMSGVIRTKSVVSGSIIIPKMQLIAHGTIIDLDTAELSGSINIPKYTPSLSGKLVWSTTVFRGLESSISSSWEKGRNVRNDIAITHGKAVYEMVGIVLPWGKAQLTYTTLESLFTKCLELSANPSLVYKQAVPLHTGTYHIVVSGSIFLKHDVRGIFRNSIPLDTTVFRSSYEALTPVEKNIKGFFSLGVGLYTCLKSTYDLGAKQYRSWLLPWSKATPLNREGFDVTKPWKPPTKKPYQGSTTLNLRCSYRGRSDNFYLNLAVNRCYTKKSIDSRSVYIVLNEITVDRYFDGQIIKPTSVSMSTDRDSWCWSFSMQVSADQAQHLTFPDNKLPLIRVVLNNKLFVFLVESKKRSRGFGQTDFTYTGRSITALLDSPHASKRTHTQPGAMTSVQLVEEELARVPDANILLDWVNLVSSNGWLLPEGALSYSNLTPMEAIKEIVKPVGGAIVSDPALPMIHIKPRTPYGYWETPAIKMSIPEDIIQQDSSDWVGAQSANAVYVYSNSVSLGGRIIRQGTAGDVLAEQMSSRMYTDADSIREAGRSALIEANPKESTQYSTAMYEQLGVPELCEALEITSENGSFWGTVDAVGIDVRVSNDVTVIDMTVGIERFLPEGEAII